MINYYNDAKNKLDLPLKKDSKKVENNTYLIRHDDYIGVRLHDTEVVKLYPNHAELFTGNWYTNTTKDRINKYSGAYVHTNKNIWYIGDFLFYEGIKVDNSGNIISKKIDPKKNEQANAKIKQGIKSFVEYAIQKIKKGIEVPSGGDCWYCAFKTQEGKTLGDTTDHDHLWGHIKEKYIVPSLVWNAVKESGYQYPEIIIGYDPKTQKSGEHCVEWALKTSLRKYLTKRLLVHV